MASIKDVTLDIGPGKKPFQYQVTVAGQLEFTQAEILAIPKKVFRMGISLFAEDLEGDDNYQDEDSDKNKKLLTFLFLGHPPVSYKAVKPEQLTQEFSETRNISFQTFNEDSGFKLVQISPNKVKAVEQKDEVYARVSLGSSGGKYSYSLAIARSETFVGEFSHY